MSKFFTRLRHQWSELFREKHFRVSFFAGLGVLAVAYILNYYANFYTSSVQVLSVGDLILDHIPTIDLSMFYIFGIYITELVFFIYVIFFKPELFPISAKTIAAFYIIRSFFISLTHLGPPANFFDLPQLTDQWGIGRYFYLNDLFFSGHTGFPYLGALLFWDNKILRWSLLAMSFAQAITVLFMHIHYSIDVFSAYFITYSIYAVSMKVFNNLNVRFRKVVQRVEVTVRMRE